MKLKAIARLGTVFLLAIGATNSIAQSAEGRAALRLDDGSWKCWTGVIADANVATAALPATMSYRLPDGPLGRRQFGLGSVDDSTIDVRNFYGLRFEAELTRDDQSLTMDFKLSTPPQIGRQSMPEPTTARIQISGKGWRTVTLPIDAFDFNRVQSYQESRPVTVS